MSGCNQNTTCHVQLCVVGLVDTKHWMTWAKSKASCLLQTSCNADLGKGPWQCRASRRHQLHRALQHMSAKQFANGVVVIHTHIWQKSARLLRPFRFSYSFRDLHLLLQLKNTRHIYTVPANFRNYFHFQHPQTFTRSSLRTKNPKQKMKN